MNLNVSNNATAQNEHTQTHILHNGWNCLAQQILDILGN